MKRRAAFRAAYLLLACSLILTSCSLFLSFSAPGSGLARLPVFDVQVTILDLALDDNDACREFCPATEYPIDEGLVRIEEIYAVDNPDNMAMEPYRQGDAITVEFQYSARPAKLRTVPAASAGGNEDPAAQDIQPRVLIAPQPVPIEDGYFIYEVESAAFPDSEEVVLAGVREGMKLRTQITYITPEKGVLGVYEILN